MTEHEELARMMRAGLERHAAEADPSAPVTARAVEAARRRGRGRLAVGAAALAVAAVAVTAAVVDLPGNDASPGVADPATGARDLPGEWRTEYWYDTQVEVPADWGWGGAPQKDFGAQPGTLWCGGPGAILDAGGARLPQPDPTVPYVGRAILQSDMCLGGIEDQTPLAPYVWLGAPIQPGTVDLGDGYVRETREVNGSTVSVATQDAATRERILDSATGGETCLSDLDAAPEPTQSSGPEGPAGLQPESLTVCAYRDDSDSGRFALVYAEVLDAAHAKKLVVGVDDAAPEARRCLAGESGSGWEYVVLRVDGSGASGEPLSREYVVDFTCSGLVQRPGASPTALTRANVDLWAVGGLKVSLTGTTGVDGELSGYFIGMQG